MKTARLFVLILLILAAWANAQESLPSQQEFVPEGGKGRVLIVLSGYSGPDRYRYIAKDLSAQGYYTLLFDGNAFPDKDAGAQLKGVIARAQQSPYAMSGKVAVIGFSMGGGYALMNATTMSDLVSAVVLFYPVTADIQNPATFGSKIMVPTLLLAGVRDAQPWFTAAHCCLIGTIRDIADGAHKGGAPAMVELVEYPDAGHGWNLKTSNYREADTADSFRRALDYLRIHFAD